MQLAPIKSIVDSEIDLVNQLIREHIHSEVPLINQIITNLTSRKGKQLRPLILLLSANSCGSNDIKQRALCATAIEYIHTTTLLHDDVIDESMLRRGTETANASFGNKAAILAGDYLYTRAMFILTSFSRQDILSLFINTIEQIVEGEIKQLTLAQTLLSEEDYFKIIKDKTSLLFSLSAEAGALLAGGSKLEQECLAAFGLHLGNTFQIIDDVLDLCADESLLGKNIGDDLAEGKSTLPLIHACHSAKDKDASYLKSCLKKEVDVELDRVLSILDNTNSIPYAKNIAKSESLKASLAISSFKDTPYKKALLALCEFALSRDH